MLHFSPVIYGSLFTCGEANPTLKDEPLAHLLELWKMSEVTLPEMNV
jgi:hypothetical protein